MILEEMRTVVHATSYRPFNMHLADGSLVRVPHPDFIALPGTGRTVIAYKEGERAHTAVDLLLVTKLEVDGSQATAQ
jgi:hypothetical protein